MKLFLKLTLASAALISPVLTPASAQNAVPGDVGFAVGPQYDTTHVYVPVADFDRFVQSFVSTFGGRPNPGGVAQVTPTPSRTRSQVVITPAGSVSVFGFLTPIPYPFGEERVGYLVSDMDGAVAAARAAGAVRVVDTFPDPIGRDTVVRWPGGSVMQLYWHSAKPNYPAPASIPESRIYLTSDAADAYVAAWRRFAHAEVISDVADAPGEEIGQPGRSFRRIRMTSGFGSTTLLVGDGALAWPYGRELTGYGVSDMSATMARAKAAGVEVLVAPQVSGDRVTSMIRFPGGYIAEVHAGAAR